MAYATELPQYNPQLEKICLERKHTRRVYIIPVHSGREFVNGVMIDYYTFYGHTLCSVCGKRLEKPVHLRTETFETRNGGIND